MAKFSAGQMVVCIDASGSEGDLVCGKAYEVVFKGEYYETHGFVAVRGVKSSWNESRFELIPQTLEKDLVKENSMKSPKSPHIHAELIKLWAAGAEIEQYSNSYGTWVVSEQPTWIVATSYRVKPEQVFPKTMLQDSELAAALGRANGMNAGLVSVANAAIHDFIVSGDMDKYIESLK